MTSITGRRARDGQGPASRPPLGALLLLPAAISLNGEHMLLHFTAISDVLSSMHAIPDGLREVTRSRLKYFQNRGFPLATKSRGKAKIGMDEALKLAFAFELLQLGMGPLRAIRLTVTDWPIVREVLAAAWFRARRPGASKRFVLAIAPRALAEMAAPDDLLNVPLSETLGAVFEASALGKGPGRASILLDVERLANDFGTALVAEGLADTTAFERAMRLYCGSVFGDDDPISWTVEVATELAATAPSADVEANS